MPEKIPIQGKLTGRGEVAFITGCSKHLGARKRVKRKRLKEETKQRELNRL